MLICLQGELTSNNSLHRRSQGVSPEQNRHIQSPLRAPVGTTQCKAVATLTGLQTFPSFPSQRQQCRPYVLEHLYAVLPSSHLKRPFHYICISFQEHKWHTPILFISLMEGLKPGQPHCSLSCTAIQTIRMSRTAFPIFENFKFNNH